MSFLLMVILGLGGIFGFVLLLVRMNRQPGGERLLVWLLILSAVAAVAISSGMAPDSWYGN